MSFLFPKPKTTTPTPPPTPATKADASVVDAGTRSNTATYSSLVSSGPGAGGLKRKASTQKNTLIGGA